MKVLMCIVFLSVLITPPLFAEEAPPKPPISLAELARKADVVMLAQVKDTDYFYRHEYPVSGSAYLKPLLHYKGGQPTDIIEVYEKGLHENECYFPNPTVFEEGRRYLLFLQQDPDEPERYRGLAEGCALDVLVDENNGYVLRYPAAGISLSDPLEELAVEVVFGDPYAIENEDSLSSTERNILLDTGLIRTFDAPANDTEPGILGVPQSRSQGKQWIYTKGIDLTTIRKLMGPGLNNQK